MKRRVREALSVAMLTAAAFGCRCSAPEIVITPPRFADVTAAAGVARTTPTYDAAVGDFDGDGALDLYIGNHGTGAVLLRNGGDGRFVDVLATSGIEALGDQHGCGWTDYDNDGRLDLHVSVGAGRGLATKQNLERGRGTSDKRVIGRTMPPL